MATLPPMLDDPARRAEVENERLGRRDPPRPKPPSSAETQGRLVLDSILWAAFLIFLLGFVVNIADFLFR